MAKQIARYDNYHSLANISADGTKALVLFKNDLKNYPTVIDLGTGKEIARFGEYFIPDTMSLSPDGMTAVLGRKRLMGDPREMGYEYDIVIWDVVKNKSITLSANFELNGFLWLDKSQFVALTRADITLYTAKGEIVKSFKIKERGGYGITRQNNIISVYGDKQIHLLNSSWELQKTLNITEILRPLMQGFYASPDEKTFALVFNWDKHTVFLWDVATDSLVNTLVGKDEVTALAWSPDGKALICAEFAKQAGKSLLVMWDIAENKTINFVSVYGKMDKIIWGIDKMIFSTDGISKDDATITVWDGKNDLINGVSQ